MNRDVRILLKEAARFHAKAAGDPASAIHLFEQYRRDYKTNPKFRAEIDAGARQARWQAELGRQHARGHVLRQLAEVKAPSPDRVDDLEEILRALDARDSQFRAGIDASATYTAWKTLKEKDEGKVLMTGREIKH